MSERRWVEQIHDDIVRVVEHRINRITPATRYGIVFGDPDPATRTCSVRVGGAPDPSPGFVYGTQPPMDGDRVRVVIDPKGDRYVAEVLGREMVPQVAALPAARAELRGRIVMVRGAVGAADTVWVCAKAADESYGWLQIV